MRDCKYTNSPFEQDVKQRDVMNEEITNIGAAPQIQWYENLANGDP